MSHSTSTLRGQNKLFSCSVEELRIVVCICVLQWWFNGELHSIWGHFYWGSNHVLRHRVYHIFHNSRFFEVQYARVSLSLCVFVCSEGRPFNGDGHRWWSSAFNGDGQKKEIPGGKEAKEIKAEEVEDRREQRDADIVRWIYVHLCVGACVHRHMQDMLKCSLQKCQMSGIDARPNLKENFFLPLINNRHFS